MDIIGILVILLMPYMAGYIIKCILNKKEISQIETYLTGFFFVFLLQGAIFSCGYMFFHKKFEELCTVFFIATIIIIALFLILLAVNKLFRALSETKVSKYHAKYKRDELILLGVLIFLLIAIAYRVISLHEYIRDDIMLPTVRTTLATNSIYEYNPITSQPFTLGMINSKKLISLPIYYAYICREYGINEITLLYFVMTIQTLMCTFFACMLFAVPVLRSRKKSIIFVIFLASLILSGDYFSGAIGAKLLWNGYSGEAIVAGVMLPYVLYILTDWYRSARGDNEDITLSTSVVNSIKLILCLSSAFYITGITTGVLLLLIEIFIMGVACFFRFRKEERGNG